MTNEELAAKLIQDELGDRPATAENVMEASIVATRKSIYMDYYYANPAVVEALLLNLRYYMESISYAMRQTVEKLYSV
jgi:hypothetical protein